MFLERSYISFVNDFLLEKGRTIVFAFMLMSVFGGCSVVDQVKTFIFGNQNADIGNTNKMNPDSGISLKDIEEIDKLLASVNESYTIDVAKLRDPFKAESGPTLDGSSLVENQLGGGGDPLTSIPLDNFTLSAVIWGISSPKAVINAANSQSYIVGIGSRIGTKFGKLVEVQKHKIVVAETVKDPTGKDTIRNFEIVLNAESEGQKNINLSTVPNNVSSDESPKTQDGNESSIDSIDSIVKKLVNESATTGGSKNKIEDEKND